MALDILTPLQQGLQIRQQFKGGQNQGLQKQILQQQLQQGEAAQQQITQDQANTRLSSVAQGAESALGLAGPDRANFLTSRLQELTSRGSNTDETQEVMALAEQFGIDSPEVNAALQEGLQVANSFGILTPQQELEQKINATRRAGEAKSVGEIRKEARGRIGTEIKDISKAASTISENAGKLTGLVGLIKKGNRTAVSQALVSLVKLGDPTSVVKEAELEMALNTANPIAALAGLGVNTSLTESLIRKIDPLNPASINTDEILSTANALISANVPSIQSRFNEQRQLASDNLTESGVKSIFPTELQSRIEGLNKLSQKVEGARFNSGILGREVSEQDINDTLSQNPGLTREKLFEQLGIK